MTADSTWIMAAGFDLAGGLVERCATAAVGLRAGRYDLVRLQLEGQPQTDRWMIPLAPWRDELPEIRVVDDPVPIREHDPSGVMELVARALSGAPMPVTDGNRAIAGLRAVVAAEALLERCAQWKRRSLRAALATPWGPACFRDSTTFTSGSLTLTVTTDRPPKSAPIGQASEILPRCVLIGFRNEPDHMEHLRIETAGVMCTDDSLPDVVETIRILADLEADPFR